MSVPMRHLLAGSAVAGLLLLLPAGHAQAQDNRNTGGWAATGGIAVLSFIAGSAGGLAGSFVLRRRFSGKLKKCEDEKKSLKASLEEVECELKSRESEDAKALNELGNL